MAPGRAHHVQLRLARRRADGDRAHAPVRSPTLNEAALSSSSATFARSGSNETTSRAPGERVGTEVPCGRRCRGPPRRGSPSRTSPRARSRATSGRRRSRRGRGAARPAVMHGVARARPELAAGLGRDELEPRSEGDAPVRELAEETARRGHRSSGEVTLSGVDLRTVPRAARRAGRACAPRAHGGRPRRLEERPGRPRALPRARAASAGGGHQFLRALLRELERRGLEVERTASRAGRARASSTRSTSTSPGFAASPGTTAGWFTASTGRSAYRGFDDGTDRRIVDVNRALADVTVLQSQFSLEKHVEPGYELRCPVVIPNAVDPAIFHPPEAREPLDGRKVRVIASSWSVNPRKGADTFTWLDGHLDRDRYELTYLGQAPVLFEWIRPSARSARTRSRPSPAGRRLRRREPRRSVLERAARGARAGSRPRTWAAAAIPSSSGRAGSVSQGRRGPRGARPARRGPRRFPRGDRDADARLGRRPVPRGSRSRAAGRANRPPWRTTCDVRKPLRPTAGRRLDAAAISRAHDVFYWSVAWTRARWLGAQALKNPLDLWVYQEILFETRPAPRRRQARTERQRPLPRVHVRPGGRRDRLYRHRASARRLPGASAHHVPRRSLVDRPRGARGRPLARRRTPDARRPRLRPLAGARRGRARGVRADRPRRRLRHRRGLEHRADPQRPHARPLQAIETFLDGNDEFEIDREREKFLITFNPSGYLRRVRVLLGGAVSGPHVRSRPRSRCPHRAARLPEDETGRGPRADAPPLELDPRL